MKLVIYPPIDEERLAKIVEAAGPMTVANPADKAEALREIVDAEAFYGKITPELLAAATQLQWVQTLTASLEHYMFPELVEHPCRLSNMRGLYSDVIASQVFGYVVCFARNLHHYIRQQGEAPLGGRRRRSGADGNRYRPCRPVRHRSRPHASPGRHPRRRRPRRDRIGGCPLRCGVQDARPGRRPPRKADSRRSRSRVAPRTSTRPAGAKRFRRRCRSPHPGDGEDVSPAAVSADEADRLLHQHRPGRNCRSR